MKDVHETPEPEWSTFSGVVSREIARVALTNAALNNVPIYAYYVYDAYLKSDSYENMLLLVQILD